MKFADLRRKLWRTRAEKDALSAVTYRLTAPQYTVALLDSKGVELAVPGYRRLPYDPDSDTNLTWGSFGAEVTIGSYRVHGTGPLAGAIFHLSGANFVPAGSVLHISLAWSFR